jgi:hypothetical protein
MGACEAPAGESRKEPSKMQPNQEIIEKLGQIDDLTLAGADEPQLLEQAYRVLAFTEWEGLVLRAPAAVALGREPGLPILVAWQHNAIREREVVLGDNAVVISNRLDGKGQWVTPLFPPSTLKIPMPRPRRPPPRPSADAAEPVGSMGVKRLDLKSTGGIPWQAGRYAVRVVSFDWVSNTVPMVLTGPEASSPPPAPGLGELGLELSPLASPVARGGPIPVRGSLRLLAGPAAGVSGYLVLVRRGVLSPMVLELEIPIRAPAGAPRGAPVDAHFAYDLNSLAGGPLPASRWQVYAIVGRHTAGPVTLNLTE